MPTAIIPFGYPYHPYAALHVPTDINACCTPDQMQQAVVDLMLGTGDRTHNSPVEPFCGLSDIAC